MIFALEQFLFTKFLKNIEFKTTVVYIKNSSNKEHK